MEKWAILADFYLIGTHLGLRLVRRTLVMPMGTNFSIWANVTPKRSGWGPSCRHICWASSSQQWRQLPCVNNTYFANIFFLQKALKATPACDCGS